MPGGKEQKKRSLKRAAENCAKLTDMMFKKKSRKKSPEETTNETYQNSPLPTEKEAVIPQNSQTSTDAAVSSDNVSDGSSKERNSRENYEPLTMAQNLKERESESLPGEDLKPNQPKIFSYPKRKFGKEERAFLPAWYDRWTWLHYDEVKDSVWCITCQNAHRHNMLNDLKIEDAFIKTGFSHWKHATTKDKGFQKHESSKCHQQAALRLVTIPRTTANVSEMLSNNLIETQRKNRESLMHIISCLRYLARQGLPLRGHGDDKDSNFTQLLKFRAENDRVLLEWLEKKNYTSPEIQNELLKEMSLSILRDIVEAIKNADFHSIMLDESSDVSNKEQAVFCCRWVDDELVPHEDFLGLYELEKADATTIANIIKDIILRLGFDTKKLRGQCYDGCSTMMGKKTGVSTQIKKDIQPLALCIHCYAHSLNLACSDWLKNSQVSKTVAKSLSTSFEITKLVKYSPKRDSHLRKIHEIQAQEETERECSKASTVRLFSETRWTVRAKSLESIYENYEALEDLWDWCSSQYKDRETKARVGGVQAQMRTFEYFFGLRLGILILRHSDNLSASLQAKDLYAAKAKHTANKTLATIKKLRTDRSFELFWDDVNLKAKKLDIDAPKLPRERRAPKLIEEYYGGGKAEPEFPNDPKSYYLQIYNDSIDCIMNAIDERFNQEDFKKYIKLEDLLLQAARGEDFSDVYNEVKKIYAKDFDYTRLEVQLKTLVEYCKDFEAKFTINSIAEILRENDAKDHLCEVYKLLKLLLVLPATNATSERTFSLMKIIKTYLRSTMKQERLNHLMI